MIFEFYDDTDGKYEVPIQVSGITYLNKDRFRSQVVVQYEFSKNFLSLIYLKIDMQNH